MTRYQFQIDGRPAGAVRTTWGAAAHDAVTDGYAVWKDASKREIKLDDTQGATIARVRQKRT